MGTFEQRFNDALIKQDIRAGRVFMNIKMANEAERVVQAKRNPFLPYNADLWYGSFRVLVDDNLADYEFDFKGGTTEQDDE